MFYIIYLLIWPLFYIISLSLFKGTKLSPWRNSYSELGSEKKRGAFFNISLIVVGVIQLYVFYIFAQNVFLSSYAKAGVILFSITTVMGILSGIVTLKKNEAAHLSLGLVGFITSILGWILFGLSLRDIYFPGYLLMIVWGVVVIPVSTLIFFTWKDKCYRAVGELSMFIGAYITGLVMFKLM
jgi:hypothetical protein